ncbi:MAG: hypothetical protein KIT84_12915 [Labilithrix sp.]|nr:hypothetical protein [Labilithrix sp.]MCW5811916.1 hypothetical protein [Labilithrix sp.]
MNGGAPTCGTCGGLNTNPQAMQCRFCGQALAPQAPPMQAQAYGAPTGYGAPPPGAYGAPQPQAYGQPYGAPNPYGQPPNPYGGPNPYGQPYPVQGFGGAQPFGAGNAYVNRGWGGGWSTFFWIRLGIAAIVIGISLLGACVNAITH